VVLPTTGIVDQVMARYLADGTDCNVASAAHWSDCSSCVDGDQDDYGAGCNLGTDCDDGDAAVNPSRPEVPFDGKDNDCNPATPDLPPDQHVVGVLSTYGWSGGMADPMALRFNVANVNKTKLAEMLHLTLLNTEVELDFLVFDYDPLAERYYEALRPHLVRLKGLVMREGGVLQLFVREEGTEVVSPRNWAVDLRVVPQAIDQEVYVALAADPSQSLLKQWGVAISALRAFGASSSFDYALSLPQGFDFQPDVQTPFGYVKSLRIAGWEFDQDIAVTVGQ
jgi:hypothetical protein